MATEAQLRDPSSVLRLAPMSGVFATDHYLENPLAFRDALLGFWGTQRNNTIPVAPDAHEDAADSAYGFYEAFREADHAGVTRLLEPLAALGKTGDVSLAHALLETQCQLHRAACRLTELYRLWDQLGRVPCHTAPTSDETLCSQAFLHFPADTPREQVWAWFGRQHPAFSAGEILEGRRACA